MQSLYAFQIKHHEGYFSKDTAAGKNKSAKGQLAKEELSLGQKELLKEIRHSYNLYIYCLYILIRFWKFAIEELDRISAFYNANKNDLKLAHLFISNKALKLLASNSPVIKLIEKEKIHHEHEAEIINDIYKQTKKSGKFHPFLTRTKRTLNDDIEIVKRLLNEIIMKEKDFDFAMESISLNWTADKNIIYGQVIQTLESIKSEIKKVEPYVLYDKNWDDNKLFLVKLFSSALENRGEFDLMIGKQTKNWDIKRITFIDNILMHMALSEMLYFDKIPLKVTMDEYIEIAKRYSTPKSKEFINGVLDRLMRILMESGKINADKKGEVGEDKN